jgi:hypothetical protein
MGTKYSSNTTSGYNSTAPSDDGTVSEANKGKWSTIKEKLADPVKTLADTINTDLVEHFDNGPVAYTSNQTIGASHYGKVIQVSGAANTQTLSDAATLGAGWNCEFVSTDTTNTVTIARATASDMVNETTANISLLPLQSVKAVVNASANGFLVGFVTRKDKSNTISESNTYSGVNTFSVPQKFTVGIGPSYTQNYSLAGTVGSNALTITLSGYDGTALSSTNPSYFTFGSATAGTGTSSVVEATGNLTLVISSGSTLGATSAVPFRVWIGIANDGGTLRLVARNCSTANNVYSITDDSIISSTAEGGAGAADSAGVWYSGTAVTSKAVRILGYMEFSLTTAGTWDEVPDKTRLWQTGMKLPGDIVQSGRITVSSVVSGATALPIDDTNPQLTEGVDSTLDVSIVPTSSANILHSLSFLHLANTTVAELASALFRDAGANAISSSAYSLGTTSALSVSMDYSVVAGSTTSTTFKIRFGSDSGTSYMNSDRLGAGIMNGTLSSRHIVEEIMG